MPERSFDEWVSEGVAAGWVSTVRCDTHDGVCGEAEMEEFFDGGDPCVPVLRVDPPADLRPR